MVIYVEVPIRFDYVLYPSDPTLPKVQWNAVKVYECKLWELIQEELRELFEYHTLDSIVVFIGHRELKMVSSAQITDRFDTFSFHLDDVLVRFVPYKKSLLFVTKKYYVQTG